MKAITFSSIFSILGTSVSALLGGWDSLLQFLIVFMILDYLTGLAAAIRKRRVNSEVMYWGGIRKSAILVVIGIATMFDNLAAQDVPVFRTLAIYFYLSREGISVIENLGQLGVPLPAFISGFLQQLKEKGGPADDGGEDKDEPRQ
jgi:toxin secretion/phage lysis holin